MIRDEISLASNRVQDEEAKLQSIERQDASNFRARLRNITSKEHDRAHEWRLQADLRESSMTMRLAYQDPHQLIQLQSEGIYNSLVAYRPTTILQHGNKLAKSV